MPDIDKASLDALREPILGILRKSDLSSISAKKVRNALAEMPDPRVPSRKLIEVRGIRLDDKGHKKDVDDLIRICFDAVSNSHEPPRASTITGNGHANNVPNGTNKPVATPRLALPGMGGVPGSLATTKTEAPKPSSSATDNGASSNKRSRKNDDVISDDEEDVEAVKRKASSASAKKTSKPAKKRKSSAADDGEKAPPNPNNPFNKPVILSDEMSKVCGEKEMPRYMITKKLWEYIKGNDLQNPQNKRQILCDPTLTRLFGQSTVDSFEMAKLITKHVTKKTD